MQTPWTGLKDVDRKILQELDDKDLFFLLLTKNIYLYKLTDDVFWRNRLINKYPTTVSYKPEKYKWKQYYLNVVFYIDKLKEKGFTYIKGDPKFIYEFVILRKYFPGGVPGNLANLMRQGYEDLAVYYVNLIRQNADYSPFVLGTPEWKDYLRAKNLIN